jgi:hypothetical protein
MQRKCVQGGCATLSKAFVLVQMFTNQQNKKAAYAAFSAIKEIDVLRARGGWCAAGEEIRHESG